MPAIPLVRATHLNVFLDVLRDIGEPVDRALDRARLPVTVEETPDLYLLVPRAMDCVEGFGAHAAMELGYRASRRSNFLSLRPAFQVAVLGARTGVELVAAILRHCRQEDGALVAGTIREGENIRLFCDLAGYDDSPALAYSEWIQIQALVGAVQSVAGPDWRPEEMTFACRQPVPEIALEAFAGTRVLTGQPHCSVLVPARIIARQRLSDPLVDAGDPGLPDPGERNFAGCVRELVKPYLRVKSPSLAAMADLVGMSDRTFQRRLGDFDRTYRQLVNEARFEVACDLLADPDIKVIDVSFAAGYENPQHFARAFRRFTQLTPSRYRAEVLETA